MCIWGGKLETYELLQGPGEEEFFYGKGQNSWEGTSSLGGCSSSEGMEMELFPLKGDQQQLGRGVTRGSGLEGVERESEDWRSGGGGGGTSGEK